MLHSGQLISRHATEKEAKTKILSVLARQLERFREQIPAWGAQRRAVLRVVARKERELRERIEEVVREKEDKERLIASNAKQYEALLAALAIQEQEAIGRLQRAKIALESSLEAEESVQSELAVDETRHRQLREDLDQTVSQLEQVKLDLEKVETAAAAPSRCVFDKSIWEQQQVRAQADVVLRETKQVEEALQQQRSYCVHLEEFAGRVSVGGGRYVLDPSLKRAASRLLAAGSKLRPCEVGKTVTSCGPSAEEPWFHPLTGA